MLLWEDGFNFDNFVDGAVNGLFRHLDRAQVGQRRERCFLLARVHGQEADVYSVRHETVGHKLEQQRAFAQRKFQRNVLVGRG